MTIRGAWVLGLVTAGACALAGCSAHPGAGRPAPSAPALSVPGSAATGTTGPVATGARRALDLDADPGGPHPGAVRPVGGGPPRVGPGLRDPHSPGEPPLAAAGAQPVVTFASVSALRQAVDGHQLPAGTRAVLYDPEVWPYTPAG